MLLRQPVIRSALSWWESDLLTGMFSSPQLLLLLYLTRHTWSYVVTVCTGNLLFWCWLWSLANNKTTYKQPINTNFKKKRLFLYSNTHIWLAETDFETTVIFKCLLISTWSALPVSLVWTFPVCSRGFHVFHSGQRSNMRQNMRQNLLE